MPRTPQDRSGPPPQRRTPPPVDVYPSEEEIALEAFRLFLAHGRLVNRVDCWRRAEAHLLDRAARRVTR